MKTDDLIRALAADHPAEAPPKRMLRWLAPALLASFALLMLTLGPRPDLVESLGEPLSVLRFVLTLLLGLSALRAVLTLARPEQKRGLFLPMLLVGVIAAGLWVWAWAATPAEGRQMAMVGKTMAYCLTTIPILSLFPVAALFALLRRGAVTAPLRAGLAAGLAGGGLAAAIYAIHCTEDSPLFYVTWYGLAILSVTLLSGLIGQRLLRW